MYNFDKIVDRLNTDNVKYDLREAYFGKSDVLPMWVADMDFETPDFIQEAIRKRAWHPIYGYSFRPEAYSMSIVKWVERRHHWKLEKDWILFSPGIVPALNMATLTYTKPGDGILVQPPVYFPFFSAVNNHNRKLIENQLVYQDGKYNIDFNDFEKKAKDAKLFFLSNPHNPVGRLWTKDELQKMGKICVENDVIIIADEIHCDLVLPGYKYIPMASLSKEISAKTVTCIAPSKTFNLAGMATSSLVIEDEGLRKQFAQTIDHVHVGSGNLFGNVASIAAYTHGDQWLDELLNYIDNNFKLLGNFIEREIPDLQLIKAEATYLAWIDFSKTGLTDEEIKQKLLNEAQLGLSPGPVFGSGGEGFQRMNLATPKVNVLSALDRLKSVFGA
ncbi:MAG: cystathionine beta-lyase [Marinilabiliales bacterium]|nr:MAG: cystathionine beta-lyase [Marinilabiliales bacterium]